VPIGVALYLTFSRGAIVTLLGGLVVLLALAPTWSQLRAVALTLETAALAVAVCAALPGVNELTGSTHDRETDGAVALAALAVLMLVAAAMAGVVPARGGPGEHPAGAAADPGALAAHRRGDRGGADHRPDRRAGTDGGGTATPRFGARPRRGWRRRARTATSTGRWR